MYCIVKYTVPLEADLITEEKTISVQPSSSKTSISYENRELLINPNCYVQLLVEHLYQETGIDKDVKIDLCDEMGRLVKLKSLKPHQYATEVLKFQETYYIVKYQCDENGHYEKFEPMLNRNSKHFSDILLKLKRNISQTRRRSSTDKKKKSRRSSERSSVNSLGSTKERKRSTRNKSFNT